VLEPDVSPRTHAFVIVNVHIPEEADTPLLSDVLTALRRSPQRLEFAINSGENAGQRLHPTRTIAYEIPIQES
jgi:hypothetical protein